MLKWNEGYRFANPALSGYILENSMGRSYLSGSPAKEGFTGKERDDETGIDYFGARYYRSDAPGFISVDPLASEFPNISSYAYGNNNPLKYTDPTGMSPVCEQQQDCDDTYEVGVIVENRLGSWEYLGGNKWKTLSLAEGNDEITSGIGYAWHRLNKTVGYTYHDFGERTIAEKTGNFVSLSFADHPGMLIAGGPAGVAAKVISAAKGGTTVLGKYPDYINLASALNARRFSIPANIWNKMSPAEQWAANVKFLDRTIARGDQIILSNPVKDINKVSGYFRKELDYLMSKGYKLSKDGSQLIK